jgi:choline dehydrogenase-like flavoprotein
VDDELSVTVRDELFSPDQLETSRLDENSPTQVGRFNGLAHCVGGTMTHWSAWSWRFRPDEFKVRSMEGSVAGASLVDWPISYEDMEPYYEKAEWEFGVSGDAQANPFGAPRKRGYPNPAHPLRAAGLSAAAGAKKLGYHPFHAPTAINSRPYGGRPGCMYGGMCVFYGCPIHAKATSLSVLIPKALATRKLDLRANAMVHQITLGKEGRARSVQYFDENGAGQEVFARQIVVSASAIGSPHLLLNSRSASFPQGLANSSGQVGRNLTLHLFPQLQYLVDEPTLPMTGINLTTAVDDLHASDSKRGFIRGGVFGEATWSAPIAYASNAAVGFPGLDRLWGQRFKDFLRTFPRQVGLIGFLEDLPMEVNRIDLDPDVKDKHGLPVPRITHKQHPNDLAMNDWYTERMREIAVAAGATETWVPDTPSTNLSEKKAMPGAAGHFHGTCRMGDDPETSVVDRWCRAHDVKNLWVVDGSFFPTSAGYNPTLTILANAYRVADHFIAEAKRQNL